MFVYQISMAWLNQMYIQNVEKAKRSFATSCRWSLVIAGSWRERDAVTTAIAASPATTRPEKW